MAKNEVQNTPTRKQQVGSVRDQALNRILVITTGAILALVIGLVGWGLFRTNVLDPQLVVAVVEGKEINGETFQSRVRLNRQQIVSEYLQNYQNYLRFVNDPGIQQQIAFQMQFLGSQLASNQVGLTTINQLVDDELIILEAQRLGLTVSSADVDSELELIFGFFPSGTPTTAASVTPFATSTLSSEQLALVTQIPTSTPDAEIEEAEPSPTVSVEEQASQPTATAYTRDAYESFLSNYFVQQEDELGMSEAGLRQLVLVNLYRNELFELLTADSQTEEEQVWARHILVEDEEVAQSLLDQLHSGADFGDLAIENSIDTSNAAIGGDLNWFSFDAMVEPFAIAAFELEIGQISDLVQSEFGWHIVQVLGREVRPIGSGLLAQQQNEVFQSYVTDLRTRYEWEIIGDAWATISPDEPDIPGQYLLAPQ
jgi:parvulin-like peptidyl-prolyl isomerase